MRVGILFESIKPDAGGGFTFQHEIVKALGDLSHESKHSFVIFYRGQGKPPFDSDDRKIKIVRLKETFLDRIFSKFTNTNMAQDIQRILCCKFSSSFEKTLLRHKIDLMYFPTPHCQIPFDIPYIATVWDLQHRLQPWFPEVSSRSEWINREFHYKTIFQRASFIITGNNSGKEEIMRFYQIPPERIKLLPHPSPSFSLNVQKSSSKRILERHGISSAFLFYPAQFWPHKNHYVVLEALRYLHNEHKIKIPLLLSGSDKGNLSFIKQLVVKYGLQDQVYFLGFVSQEDLVVLYQNALALIYPSYFGPENLPPLEAFAIGCPVIASNVAGTVEQLGEAALLFDPKDHVQLASAIRGLLNDTSSRLNLISRGKLRAESWTSRDYVRGIFSILDDFEIVRYSWNHNGYHGKGE